MTSGLRDQHTEMSYSLVLHQSYCCQVKYSEKQIGFSHGNLYNLHLLSNSSPAKTWHFYTKQDFLFHIDRYHFDGPSSSESKEPRVRLLEIEANAVIYIHPKFSNEQYTYIQNSQMNMASGAGNPGWSRTRPKLVCCEAWLRSN